MQSLPPFSLVLQLYPSPPKVSLIFFLSRLAISLGSSVHNIEP